MALRDPSVKAKGTRWDNVQMQDVPGDDYRSSQVRDLRDAVDEWIEERDGMDNEASRRMLSLVATWAEKTDKLIQHLELQKKYFRTIEERLEALESKMVDNTPKGGYNLKSEGTK